MSLRCRWLQWHSFRLIKRDAQKTTVVECRRCRHRLRFYATPKHKNFAGLGQTSA